MNQSRYRHLIMLCTALTMLIVVTALPVGAQERYITDDQVNAVAKMLYCPVCENIPLDSCGTQACIQWKEQIRAQLAAGQSADEIVQAFIDRFGERVVGTPQDPTLRALSLVTPWVLAAIVLIGGVYTLWRWQKHAPEPATPVTPPPASDDYRARLEADLRDRQ